MIADVDQVGSDELDGYRAELQRCREAAVTAADEAVRQVMAYNAGVLARIDAALAALEPSPGESACEHRARIGSATAKLECDSFLGGE